MYNVLIVDDERNIQSAYIHDIKENLSGYEVLGTLSSAEDAFVFCDVKKVDLILMDINTKGDQNGIEATLKLKEKFPNTKIIITTSYIDIRMFALAESAGAESFWLKDFSKISLSEVIQRTMNGEHIYPEKIPDIQIGNANLSEFTPTELRVLYLLLQYVSVKKIASHMNVQESTIKSHILHMCQKVGCDNKAELAIWAVSAKVYIPNKNRYDENL